MTRNSDAQQMFAMHARSSCGLLWDTSCCSCNCIARWREFPTNAEYAHHTLLQQRSTSLLALAAHL